MRNNTHAGKTGPDWFHHFSRKLVSGFAGQKFKLQNLMNPNRLVGRFDRLVLARAEEMHGEMKNGKKNVKRIGIPFAKYL
jgi:hypothetical protein